MTAQVKEIKNFEKHLDGFSNRIAINYFGYFADLFLDKNNVEALKQLLDLEDKILDKDLDEKQLIRFNYFISNVWDSIRKLTLDEKEKMKWGQDSLKSEIIYLRKAAESKNFKVTDRFLRCKILTNLGNFYSRMGRIVEAIEYWDEALDISDNFVMALGNKCIGIKNYARYLQDKGYKRVFLNYSYQNLKEIINKKNIHSESQKIFKKNFKHIDEYLSSKVKNKEFYLEGFSLGETKEEIKYRKWCMRNRLFLNPLNDLGEYTIAARDRLHLPNITTKIKEGPYYLSFYNQMKQEFVSARFLYYESLVSEEVHFSDKEVYLYNTMDYSDYSFAVEKIKVAYRTLYSLFDKIAYFLVDYLNIKINNRVYFKNIWYKNEDYTNELKEKFSAKYNWPLNGLFWLSKDLFYQSISENEEENEEKAIDPEARKIVAIRNHLEHKFLKIKKRYRDNYSIKNDIFGFSDPLAYSISRNSMEEKTLKLLKLVRSALIYLHMAVYAEEYNKMSKNEDDLLVSSYLQEYEEQWKV